MVILQRLFLLSLFIRKPLCSESASHLTVSLNVLMLFSSKVNMLEKKYRNWISKIVGKLNCKLRIEFRTFRIKDKVLAIECFISIVSCRQSVVPSRATPAISSSVGFQSTNSISIGLNSTELDQAYILLVPSLTGGVTCAFYSSPVKT